MIKGGSNVITFLGVVAVAAVIYAVFANANAENNSFEKLNTNVNSVIKNSKESVAACNQFKDNFEAVNDRFNTLQQTLITTGEAVERAVSPLQAKLKELDEQIAILKIQLAKKTQTVHLKYEGGGEPFPISIIQTKPPPSTGHGKDSLLNRAGIVQGPPARDEGSGR